MQDGVGVDRGDGGDVGRRGRADRERRHGADDGRGPAKRKAPALRPGLVMLHDLHAGRSDHSLRLPNSESSIWNMLMKFR